MDQGQEPERAGCDPQSGMTARPPLLSGDGLRAGVPPALQTDEPDRRQQSGQIQWCAKIVTDEPQSRQCCSLGVDGSIPRMHRVLASPGMPRSDAWRVRREHEHVRTSSFPHIAMAPVRVPLRLRARELDGRARRRPGGRERPDGTKAEPAGCAVHPPSSWAAPASQFHIRERRTALIVSAEPIRSEV